MNSPWSISKSNCLISSYTCLQFACSCFVLLKTNWSCYSQGFICPLCMKRCVTAIDLSEHYQEVHTGHEARGQELLSDSTVTVGPYLLLWHLGSGLLNIALFPCLGVGSLLCYKGMRMVLVMHAWEELVRKRLLGHLLGFFYCFQPSSCECLICIHTFCHEIWNIKRYFNICRIIYSCFINELLKHLR